jgi:hypothetical protein
MIFMRTYQVIEILLVLGLIVAVSRVRRAP